MKTNLTHQHRHYFLLISLLFFTVQFINAQTGNTNLALNKNATASSLEASGLTPSKAFDGDLTTRFSSGYDDNAWISVDLGSSNLVKTAVLTWEHDYGKDFNILFSNDGSYTDLYKDSIQVRNNILSSNSVAGTNVIIMKANTIARYVRMQGVHRATGNGYSLYEFQVMGQPAYENASFLPASFTGFAVSKQNNGVLVSWTMLIEANNAGFSIERSEDGVSFNPVGWVTGQNNGTNITHYSFTDMVPVMGKSYYRIRSIDVNGKAAYSQGLVINYTVIAGIKAYPVPVKDHIVIDFNGISGEATLSILNAAGQPVFTDNVSVVSGQSTIIRRNAGLNTGMYFLTISSGGKVYTQQLYFQ